jgi:hypothetical protein
MAQRDLLCSTARQQHDLVRSTARHSMTCCAAQHSTTQNDLLRSTARHSMTQPTSLGMGPSTGKRSGLNVFGSAHSWGLQDTKTHHRSAQTSLRSQQHTACIAMALLQPKEQLYLDAHHLPGTAPIHSPSTLAPLTLILSALALQSSNFFIAATCCCNTNESTHPDQVTRTSCADSTR